LFPGLGSAIFMSRHRDLVAACRAEVNCLAASAIAGFSSGASTDRAGALRSYHRVQNKSTQARMINIMIADP
jgi:hypothetical protein